MPDRILSAGSAAAAALAALVFFAGEGAAQAARCPLGEIYRPSRGVCVTKDKAIQAGVYHAPQRLGAPVRNTERLAFESQDAPKSNSIEKVAPMPPQPRPQALAAIERRAPAPRPRGDGALAFTTDSKPSASNGTSLMQPRSVQAVPVTYSQPAPSPFGSLVALEPIP